MSREGHSGDIYRTVQERQKIFQIFLVQVDPLIQLLVIDIDLEKKGNK